MSFPGMTKEQADNYKHAKAEHVKPTYHGYKGGFDRTTVCNDCYRTALYEDQTTMHPCPSCGGTIREGAVCKWIPPRKRWLTKNAYAVFLNALAVEALKPEKVVRPSYVPPANNWLMSRLVSKNTIIVLLAILALLLLVNR